MGQGFQGFGVRLERSTKSLIPLTWCCSEMLSQDPGKLWILLHVPDISPPTDTWPRTSTGDSLPGLIHSHLLELTSQVGDETEALLDLSTQLYSRLTL